MFKLIFMALMVVIILYEYAVLPYFVKQLKGIRIRMYKQDLLVFVALYIILFGGMMWGQNTFFPKYNEGEKLTLLYSEVGKLGMPSDTTIKEFCQVHWVPFHKCMRVAFSSKEEKDMRPYFREELNKNGWKSKQNNDYRKEVLYHGRKYDLGIGLFENKGKTAIIIHCSEDA